jgi:hypothetical protein
MQLTHEINFIAVFVCSLIAMGVGVLYHSPMLLGKIWIESLDKSEDDIEKNFKSIKTLSVSFLSQLVMTYVLALLISYTNATTPEEGLRVGFLAWMGFVGTTMTITYLYEGKTFKHFIVDSGYHFVVLLVNGFILGMWQ